MKITEYEKIKNTSQNIDFNSYWCSKCDKSHRKFSKKNVYSITFAKHLKYLIDLSENSKFIKRLKSNWKSYGKSKDYIINKKIFDKDQEKIKNKKEI